MKPLIVFTILGVFWLGGIAGNCGRVAGATLTVTGTNDSGAGSLREAILNSTPGDQINFAVTGIITLTNGELLITKNVTIKGPGASNLTVSGNFLSRILKIAANGNVSVSGLSMRDGLIAGASGTNNPSGAATDGE